MLKDQTGADLERLAINETVLTYALANSLKDKDRLTQKDIQMAKELVNVFPLLRGQKQVIKSLEAVNETILADIEASENLSILHLVAIQQQLINYRRKYGVALARCRARFSIRKPFLKMKSTIDLLEKLGEHLMATTKRITKKIDDKSLKSK